MELLEREHPLEVIEDRARRAAGGHGSVVLVAGEAGIGKTVLLRALVERTRTTAQPLWGMCDSLSTPRPLGPLRDVAHELGPDVAALLRGTAAQHEIFSAVLDALRARPRVFVVEDLHWADEATLDLVRFLARRIATLPLLLVLSYRDALGADHPLSPVLGDLVSSPDARRLQLTPLSRSAVATLLDGHRLDPADVHRRTAGNPFFVSQILAQPESPLPESVRDAVLARTAGLAPDARRCLELLSCTPEPVGAELLAALGVATATVEVLTGTGLLDRHGRGVAFRHEIARSVVLGAAVPGSERALHAAMIDALESVGGEPSVLAHHAAAAGDVPRILRYAPAAAAEASRSGAHREAVAFYETALRHVGDDTATCAGLLEAHVRRPVPHRPAPRRHRGPGAGARAAARHGRRGRGRRRAHGALHVLLVRGRPRLRRAARPGGRRDPLGRPTTRGRSASPCPGTSSSPPGVATPRRRDGRGTARRGSRTSWAATSRCAAPRRSGSRSRGCSRATWAGAPTCSRPPTSACGTGSTTWRRRR